MFHVILLMFWKKIRISWFGVWGYNEVYYFIRYASPKDILSGIMLTMDVSIYDHRLGKN